MNNFLPFFLLIPLLGLLMGFLGNNKQEKYIYWTSFISLMSNLTGLILLLILWRSSDHVSLFFKGPILYHAGETEFSINFFFDGYAFVYLLVSTLLTTLVAIFSRYYMHREKGYKRFFNNLLFFYIGLSTVVLAGNLETLFMGWEILGVTSFFLIGFYRERYLPVKNALKVVSLYRVADIALLMGIWISHHYFGHSINFVDFDSIGASSIHGNHHRFYEAIIPGLFLLAAMVKSGQVPFSFWLPRAMEGPTTSSAIFYGSLSVHIGVFLLIRTAPLWEDNIYFQALILLIGVATSITATLTARVQSSIKTQIAYSAIAQIGLMFIEVALGFYWLAMIHFASNAFLRCYQLLVSPSVLSYRIHDQFFNFTPPLPQKTASFFDKIKLSVYVLSVKEFNLDKIMYRFLWNPLKKIGNLFSFLDSKSTFFTALPLFFIGLYLVYHKSVLPNELLRFFPEVFAILGLVLILKSFVERKSSMASWCLILLNQLYLSLSIGLNEEFDFNQVHIYLSGILISGAMGIWVINRLSKAKEDTSLDQFHGHAFEYPRVAFLFAIACLGLAGFPITPTFLGEDLMLGHIHENQFPLLLLTVLNLILDGLVIFRIYSRLFLGHHNKGYHEVAYRSS
ncbi:MAG: proton-conducting transporter membrane subunit [Saprospiraceae bacterium]